MAKCTRHPVGKYWKQFVVLLTPLILLLPLLLIPEEKLPQKANQCLYVMIMMAVYWCTEALPLAVTAFIPIFVFPMLGLLSASEVCSQYLKDIIMMFVGGLMVALAVEKCNLHKRIAIGVLHLVGTKPLWLMLGFMFPTWFLSMWISNTATTAMMIPIAEAVLESLTQSYKEGQKEKKLGNGDVERIVINGKKETNDGESNLGYTNETEGQSEKGQQQSGTSLVDPTLIVMDSKDTLHPDMSKTKDYNWDIHNVDSDDDDHITSDSEEKSTGNARLDKFAKGMTLAVAYAANTGGTATLTGTGPNIIMKGFADDIWQERGFESSPVTFASWVVFGMPLAIINVIFIWLWLTVIFNGCKALCPCMTKYNEEDKAIKRVIDREYKMLGKITYAEVMVAFMFVAMVILWFFRSPGFIIGWSNLPVFRPKYIHDAVVSMFIAFVLCIIPNKLPNCRRKYDGPVDTLLDWKTIQNKLPWGIIFLMGGGFALAKASTASGLSTWIADELAVMASWPGWVMVLVFCVIVAFMTEITSNSATCTILMPIAASLADGIGTNPLYLMFPVALTTSFAFMLPVATPPNAIAFSFGRIKIVDMIKAGFLLNFLCVGVVTLGTHTWAYDFFNLHTVPWTTNITATTLSPA